MQMTRKILPAVITSAVLASALMAGPAFADDTTRTSGAITAASIVSDAATKPESGQKPIPDNILAGSQDALKDAYISAVSPHYLAKKLAAAAANGSSLAKEGNAEFYRDAVAVLSKERPGWEMMIPSKALKLSNTEADKFEMAAATAVSTRYTQLAGDSSVTVTGPKAETRAVKDAGNVAEPGTTTETAGDGKCVVALDPGHNGAETAELDPKTKVLMKDYPNGREDEDAMAVANKVKEQLSGAGYTVVLLKEKVTDNVTYRARVTKAEEAGAKIAVSIHTTPGDASEVYEQVLGGWRSPEGQPDQAVKFTNEKTAAASHEFAQKFSTTRAEVEGHAVPITQNDFTPRPGLWDGNLPVISLLSENVPWVYNEYAGGASGGGANGISPEQIDSYANGLTKSIKNAVKCEKRDVEDAPGKTKASSTETPKPSDTTEPAEPTTSTEPTTPVMR